MKWSHWILYAVSLPWNLLVAWPIVIAIRLLWGRNLHWETPPPYTEEKGGGGGPCLVCQIKPGSFPVRKGIWPTGWYLHDRKAERVRPWGGTTLGHGIFYGPTIRMDEWGRTKAHEHVHVEQNEAAMLRSFIVGLAVGIVFWSLGHPVAGTATFLAVWTSGYLMMGVSGWLTAVLRGEPHYWGAHFEEAARAQDDHLAER